MDDRKRTDLPHDQVAQDNDGFTSSEGDYSSSEFDEKRETSLDDSPYAAEVDRDSDESGYYENDFLTGKTYFSPEDYNEESAAEIAPPLNRSSVDENDSDELVNEEQVRNIEYMEEKEAGNTALGWTALVVSIVSLFILPILAGTVGAVTGFFALRNGARTLGGWAIAIGVFSIIMSLFISPFVR
ncbi:hypothetical protein [Bacillus horti]|uniref:DUF308 domain-containing protein n=1 Tax=Caldalkalibacillus horti TaxID=77523 RepID=A0ABT9W4X2_9BACI|nr:hypothetical protein [Bacillus horti]MDQ0168109.1 hypothetical protein [Bacillus horti]